MSNKFLNTPKFSLWLEFEEVEPESWDIYNDYCNIHINFEDGKQYGLNIWTFDYFKTIIEDNLNKEKTLKNNDLYILPPDLFVKQLTRDCIEATIKDLLQYGDLEQVLNNNIIA
ncbi:hypothetical protein PFY12_13705 [Chryseobacterium camelliae]|uniref:Uncharacterized protein n=1 Tax=Chryseobacterium camelliae TaxID=1265445 RepID=A0ABY7QM86_9FLAO|nr:hypothetical protein [Chryseobacterium camelliae]WBV60087.1 hypothetical protein PFY12_13705 [Chryseobacterium camelliae]